MSEVSERGIRDDALLDQVLAAVDRPALVCDTEGVVRAWNGALADVTGGPTPDGGGTAARDPAGETTLAAAPVSAVVDWDGDDPVERATASGETASGTGRLATDGRRYEVTARPLTRDSVVGAVLTFERSGGEPAENAVEVSNREGREQRLRAVIESSPDSIAMQDTDGRYRVVNEAMVDVAGRDRATLRRVTPHDVFDDETAARVERHRRDVLETEAARVVEEPGDIDVRQVTDAMDVASTTLLQHLRKSHGRVLEALFES